MNKRLIFAAKLIKIDYEQLRNCFHLKSRFI